LPELHRIEFEILLPLRGGMLMLLMAVEWVMEEGVPVAALGVKLVAHLLDLLEQLLLDLLEQLLRDLLELPVL